MIMVEWNTVTLRLHAVGGGGHDGTRLRLGAIHAHVVVIVAAKNKIYRILNFIQASFKKAAMAVACRLREPIFAGFVHFV